MKKFHAIDPDILVELVHNTAPFLFLPAHAQAQAQEELGTLPKGYILPRGYTSPAEAKLQDLGCTLDTAPELFATDRLTSDQLTADQLTADQLTADQRQANKLAASESGADKLPRQFRYVDILREARALPTRELSLHEYFELCLAAHFATVGTFVPTDVDLAIRQKLWNHVHGGSVFELFWQSVQDFHTWDESVVSKRTVFTRSGLKLSGHQGEWFSVAMGAYGCALKVAHEFVPEIREAIEREFKNQEQALIELKAEWEAEQNPRTMKNLLGGIAAVAHNLGDLDRMFEAWEIPETDALKRRVFRAGHEDARHPREIFLYAGKIYQSLLAPENHRHFALRDPKQLRLSSRFLLPFGPFFDTWGKGLVRDGLRTGLFQEGDLRDIVEALVTGWKKLNANSIYASLGYARALYGIASELGVSASSASADSRSTRGSGDTLDSTPSAVSTVASMSTQMGSSNAGPTPAAIRKAGLQKLENLVPPSVRKDLTESGLRTLFQSSEAEFEKKWMSKLRALSNDDQAVE